MRKARAEGRPLPRDVGNPRRAPAVITTPAGTITKTANQRAAANALNAATGANFGAGRTKGGPRPMGDVQIIAAGPNVTVLATFNTPNGPRSKKITKSRAEWAAMDPGDFWEVVFEEWESIYGE